MDTSDQRGLGSFHNKRIAVVGDIMLDRFLEGTVTRKSPEADASIVLWHKENDILGGAANVAVNIKALGSKPELFSIVGQDDIGKTINRLLVKSKIKSHILVDKKRMSTLKARIFGNSKYLIRLDKETDKMVAPVLSKKLFQLIQKRISSYDAIVLSDYKKGTLSKHLVHAIIRLAVRNKIPIIADVKPQNMLWFKGVTIVKPNNNEAVEMAGTNNLRLAASKISSMLGAHVLVTRGAKGMLLCKKEDKNYLDIKGLRVLKRDGIGAGDTALAALSILIAAGQSPERSAQIANVVSTLSVTKRGTTAVTLEELKKYLNK